MDAPVRTQNYVRVDEVFVPELQCNKHKLTPMSIPEALDWAQGYPSLRVHTIQYGLLGNANANDKYHVVTFTYKEHQYDLPFVGAYKNDWFGFVAQAVDRTLAPMIAQFKTGGEIYVRASEQYTLTYMGALNTATEKSVNDLFERVVNANNTYRAQAVEELNRLNFDITKAVRAAMLVAGASYNTLFRSKSRVTWRKTIDNMRNVGFLIEKQVHLLRQKGV